MLFDGNLSRASLEREILSEHLKVIYGELKDEYSIKKRMV
jgi:hypothetical protein